MKRKIIFFVVPIVIMMVGCSLSSEERNVRQFLSLWDKVCPFYTNKVSAIATRGFLNPETITLLHQDLQTNEAFVTLVTQKFSSLESYIQTFSNITLHYAYISFSESLAGRSPEILIRELNDVLKQEKTITNTREREKRRSTALLLQQRLREYQLLQAHVSPQWVKLVHRYAKELGHVYSRLISGNSSQ
ncbi:MAG: hypothetical protein N2314_07085 [Brevinematales bacterium]|nr:hypothetical protein [Brevinematales bacterium]